MASDSEIDELRREVAQNQHELAALRSEIAQNRSQIISSRRSQGLMESAFYFLLAVIASALVGFVRSPDGSWSFGIKSEIVLALIGSGGVARAVSALREKDKEIDNEI